MRSFEMLACAQVSIISTDLSFAGLLTCAHPELLLALLSTTSKSLSSLVLRATDSTATGSTDEFLSSKLRFTQDAHGQDICLVTVEEDEIGVMMGWERPIMQETVAKLCHEPSLKILNVGFGLGIVMCSAFSSLSWMV